MLRGYRIYNVVGGKNPYLVGLFNFAWMRNELQAECLKWEPMGYEIYGSESTVNALKQQEAANHIKEDTCSCGIYALYNYKDYLDIYEQHHIAWAAVIGWGESIQAERGWRAQFVRIEHLWLLPECRFVFAKNFVNAVMLFQNPDLMVNDSVCGGKILFNTLHGGFFCEQHAKESHDDLEHFITMEELLRRLADRYQVPVKIISDIDEIG